MKSLKKLYIGTNTKMYQTIAHTCIFLSRLKELSRDLPPEQIELFVLPSFTALSAAVEASKNSIIRIGSQTMSWEDQGPFTGEISPVMLEEVGVNLVMTGHSERRRLFGESNEDAARRIAKALEHNFTALLCIGETRTEKEAGRSDEVLRTQLLTGLGAAAARFRLTAGELGLSERLWIAYEPVWSIGSNGIPADGHHVVKRVQTVKRTLRELFGTEAGADVPILYGGSVNAANADKLIQTTGIDGLFIGRSAWDADRFSRIIHSVLSQPRSSFTGTKGGSYDCE